MIEKVNQQELVFSLAQELKNHIEMPQWAQFVKTGTAQETLPRNPDWWYIRAASILLKSHKKGPIGVAKLRTIYGGRKNRGVRPDAFALASGKIIRVILQQLETAQLVKQHSVGVHKGRIATPKGISLMSGLAKKTYTTATAAKKQTKQKTATKKTPKKETTPNESKEETSGGEK